MIERIHHSAVAVPHVEEAAPFYEKILGLTWKNWRSWKGWIPT